MVAKYEMTFFDYWRVIRKWKWMVLFITLMVGGLSVLYVSFLKEVYVSRGRVEVIRSRINDQAGGYYRRSVVAGPELEAAVEDAKSKELRELAALHILQDPKTSSLFGGSTEDLADKIERELAQSIEVRHGSGGVLAFTARSQSQDKAPVMVQKMMEAFVEYEKGATQRQDNTVIEWLDKQIEIYSETAALFRTDIEELQRQEYLSNLNPNAQIRLSDAGAIVKGMQEARDKQDQVLAEIHRLELLSRADTFSYEDVAARVAIGSASSQTYNALRGIQARLVELSQKYTPSYPPIQDAIKEKENLEQKLSALLHSDIVNAIAAKKAQMEAIRAELQRLGERRDLLLQRIDVLPDEQQKRLVLDQELSKYSGIASSFLQKKQDIQMSRAMVMNQDTKITEDATRPQKPDYPKRDTIIVSGLLIGIFLGLAGAFLRESMDSSMATIEDVEHYIGKPVVALIPAIRPNSRHVRDYQKKNKSEKAEYLITMVEPRSPASEAYRTLRTNLLSTFFNEEHKLLAVTSATPQEGKTTTSANLAVTMAGVGKRTMLVGCNLRHPSLSDYFPVNNRLGIQNLISGEKSLDEVIQPSGIENLDILDSGGYLQRPSEVLENPGMDLLLNELKERYDIVILDTPPVLPVTDAAILARKVDGVLLIYYFGVAAREALFRARIQLENVGTNIVGVLLNDIKAEGEKLSYYYYYSHGYGEAPSATGQR